MYTAIISALQSKFSYHKVYVIPCGSSRHFELCIKLSYEGQILQSPQDHYIHFIFEEDCSKIQTDPQVSINLEAPLFKKRKEFIINFAYKLIRISCEYVYRNYDDQTLIILLEFTG